MNTILYTWLLSIALLSNSNHSTPTDKDKCNFGSSLSFKNGKAIVLIKAVYYDETATSHYWAINELHKAHQLNKTDYLKGEQIPGEGYMYSGAAVTFIPENCDARQNATRLKKLNVKKLRHGQTIYLKCTFYKGFANIDKSPFCLVDAIYTTKP